MSRFVRTCWAVASAALALVAVGLVLADGGGDRTVEATGPEKLAPALERLERSVITPAAPTAPSPATSTPASSASASATAAPDRSRALPDGIEPARLRIPAIGVDAPSVDLRLAGDEPEVPEDFSEVGWYTATRRPGEIGPAVLAGHIDSTRGPAVFFRLDELVPGDEIVVESADGDQRVFAVTRSGQYPKQELPTEVFGFGEPVPELRLITCGGTFDRSTGHYRDNYVVYAQELAP